MLFFPKFTSFCSVKFDAFKHAFLIKAATVCPVTRKKSSSVRAPFAPRVKVSIMCETSYFSLAVPF